MRVGVQLPEVERVVRWPEMLAIAQTVEDAGFDSIWVGDHLLYRDESSERGPLDAWTQLAALAASTSRVTLGPLVAATAFHAPGIIARMSASIAEVSGGRFVLGIGAGWNEPEFRAFGFPYDHLASRFVESFEVVRRLLAAERVTLDGTYVSVADAVVLPPPAQRVPIMIGSKGSRVLEASLAHVDAWNAWYSWYGNSPEGFARERAKVDEICRRVGRDVATLKRSACVLVSLEGTSRQRRYECDPVSVRGLRDHLAALASAGVDEAILVLDPIDEGSVRTAGRMR
ncbi:MAG TPA: LLM class flavin-dependent oxidoreductase [Candidatus Acidoferrales bacterium]|nr:LLM class flavin-dependent oxidoreductase [Candidatus Acidoferrales bacterium]